MKIDSRLVNNYSELSEIIYLYHIIFVGMPHLLLIPLIYKFKLNLSVLIFM